MPEITKKKKLENVKKGEEEKSSQSPRVFPGGNTECKRGMAALV